MTFNVDLERDEAGWWVASVREVRGCHAQGRSIRQALARVRRALATCVGDTDAESAEFVPRVHLPDNVRRAVARYDAAAERLERERASSRDAAAGAVDVLTKDLGLSVRDAADVLGLSHQRVHQLAKGR